MSYTSVVLSSIFFFNTVYAQSSSSVSGDIEKQIQELIGNSMNKMIDDTINQVQQGINGTTSQDIENLNSPDSKLLSSLESIGANNFKNPYSPSEGNQPSITLFANSSKFPDNSDLAKKIKSDENQDKIPDPSVIGMDSIASKSSEFPDNSDLAKKIKRDENKSRVIDPSVIG
ncbi:MAG: hypothetical protein R3321_08970, partial [Nitrososphaeraceae archaeon]|nr:hypothetical protein [Nitrososphaeraceae archaeon]